ncbi:MAG: AAA family ATPase [Lachnospiraceae bacterium]|nr:AAA family ATPase [Lachnospiraceae bacterium]
MFGFDKIIGYDEVKSELERFCDVLKNSEKYERLGVTLPSGILFYGEPGIGKTLMARTFIEETGCKSYTIRKDTPDGDFTNLIRQTFEKARQEDKCIVFLDDLDKFANEDEKHPDAEEYVTVQACIDDSRNDGVFVIATINDKSCLPKSLLRTGRFDKIIGMSVPRYDDLVEITKHYLSKRSVSADVDAEEIAAMLIGRPISDIKAAINDAGINAGFEGRVKIRRHDILRSIKGLLFDSPECLSMDETDSASVPVHEIGHVLVAEVLEPGSVSLVSIDSHNGCIGGVTRIRSRKDVLSSAAMENQAIWGLGGRAATELFFGSPDIGSNSDIAAVHDIVDNLVCGEAMAGFETFSYLVSYGGGTDDRKSLIVAHEMERYYRKAKEIIASNRDLFCELLQGLKERKTLTGREIREIIDTFSAVPQEFHKKSDQKTA